MHQQVVKDMIRRAAFMVN